MINFLKIQLYLKGVPSSCPHPFVKTIKLRASSLKSLMVPIFQLTRKTICLGSHAYWFKLFLISLNLKNIPLGCKVYLFSLYHIMNHHTHPLFLKIIMVIITPFGCQIFPLEVECFVKRNFS